MFSSRTPLDLRPNRLARAVEEVRRSGRTLIDLTESNPTRAGFAYAEDLLAPLSDPAALLYEPSPFGRDEARRAVAREYGRRGLSVDADRIVLTASTSEAYAILFKLLADADDEVLTPRPSYPLFDHLARLDLVRAVPYDLEYHGRWCVDVASLARAATSRTRAILLVSPNNPTGSFVAAADLDRVCRLAAASGAAVINDEVFADYELDAAGQPHGETVGRSDVLTFSLGGLSKSAGLPQAKLAWIAVSGPDGVVAETLSRLEVICDTYLSVSTPVQVAAPALLARGAEIRDQILARVRANYRCLVDRATDRSGCRVLAADAGWYAVVQVPTFESEEDLVVDLAVSNGVLAHPGYFFDFPRESFLVLSLLPEPSRFRAAVDRVIGRFEAPRTRTR